MGTTRTIVTAPSYAGGQAGARRNARPARKHECDEHPVQHDELHLASDRRPAGRTAADTLINDASVRATTGQTAPTTRSRFAAFRCPQGRRFERHLRPDLVQPRSAYFIERIELLLGPGALMNGIAPGGSVGGGINIVTKRAGENLSPVSPRFHGARHRHSAPPREQRSLRREPGVGSPVQRRGRNGEASIDDGD